MWRDNQHTILLIAKGKTCSLVDVVGIVAASSIAMSLPSTIVSWLASSPVEKFWGD